MRGCIVRLWTLQAACTGEIAWLLFAERVELHAAWAILGVVVVGMATIAFAVLVDEASRAKA